MSDRELIEAAKAVIARWDSKDWKAPPTAEVMNRLRNALAELSRRGSEVKPARWVPATSKGSFSSPPSDTPLLVRPDDGRVMAAMWHKPERGYYDDGGFSEIEAVEYLVIKEVRSD
jgi:hypothetical protein